MAKNATIDLSKLNASELQALKQRIDRELEGRKQKDKEEALQQIRQIAAKAGYALEDLVGGRKGRRRSPAPVKYRDPKDPSRTWAGRGRKPRWLEQALAEGRPLKDFEV